MHEASSDWDAGEKVVKPDQAFSKVRLSPKEGKACGGTSLHILSSEWLSDGACSEGLIRDSSFLTTT